MKKRLDIAMVEQCRATGRDNAKGIIMSGIVYVTNQNADKPGLAVDEH